MVDEQSFSEWNGDILPEAGHICDVSTDGGRNWRTERVLFTDDNVLLMTSSTDRSGYKILWWSDEDLQFRALRTPEREAAEAREKALDEMLAGVPILAQVNGLRAFAEKLYEDGYRKTE